jgi:hypothetical protein
MYKKKHSYKHNEQINNQDIDNSECLGAKFVKIYPETQESEVLSIIRYRGTSKIAGQLATIVVAQRSSRCPYTLLLIELPTPVPEMTSQWFWLII